MLVIGVQAGYPAALSGIAVGDIITKAAGEPIIALTHLKEHYQRYVDTPAPLLIEAQRNRRIALYVFKP